MFAVGDTLEDCYAEKFGTLVAIDGLDLTIRWHDGGVTTESADSPKIDLPINDDPFAGQPTGESWDEMVGRHVRSCKKAESDEYCKICAEY
ncbi:hypothetical protein [Streptomyces sp. NPDC086776]|uniref:hypothetical protein n=1 Tax=Streptomyces sp. NPDC086776 TaxID=3365756 RepID=UPI0038154D79